MQNVAILLLAAGSSSRLGQPKQLLDVGGITLLERTAGVALAANCAQTVVVLGAFFEKTAAAIAHLPVQVVFNENWAEGIGSSIACGVQLLLKKQPPPDAAILLLCDQYRVTSELLEKLVALWQNTGARIVAAEYEGSPGPPALFDRRLFDELAALKGETGAKRVILAHLEALETALFPEGKFDVDVIEDLKLIQQRFAS
jgi:molybdenum cofactor cytidylyltransferase